MQFRNVACQNIPLSKQPFKTQPQFGNEDITQSPQYNLLGTRINERRASSLQGSGVRWLIFNSSRCTGNTYHLIYAQVQYEFCISFPYSWIDVLNLNQPFNWTAEIWQPFKMKLIWELQPWMLNHIYWRERRAPFIHGPRWKQLPRNLYLDLIYLIQDLGSFLYPTPKKSFQKVWERREDWKWHLGPKPGILSTTMKPFFADPMHLVVFV
jgi:hypothetical protein